VIYGYIIFLKNNSQVPKKESSHSHAKKMGRCPGEKGGVGVQKKVVGIAQSRGGEKEGQTPLGEKLNFKEDLKKKRAQQKKRVKAEKKGKGGDDLAKFTCKEKVGGRESTEKRRFLVVHSTGGKPKRKREKLPVPMEGRLFFTGGRTSFLPHYSRRRSLP